MIEPYKKTKVIVIANHKGGVSKTTLAKLITEYLVNIKKKSVLGVDIDPQTNFSTRFIDMQKDGTPPVHPDFDPKDEMFHDLDFVPPGYWSIAQFFRLGYVLPYPTLYKNLSFIPSHKQELTAFLEDVNKTDIDQHVISHMRDMFEDEFYQESYDYIVIDTPPQTSALIASAFRAATHLLIPTQLDDDSLSGMGDMAQMWRNERNLRVNEDDFKLIGIIPTQYNKARKYEFNSLEKLKAHKIFGQYIFNTPMRDLSTYHTSSSVYSEPKSLFNMHDRTVAKKEALLYCEEIYKRTL